MKKMKYILTLIIILGLFLSPSYLQASTINTFIKNGKITPHMDFTCNDDIKSIIPLKSGVSRLFDYAAGYSIDYPSHMCIDATISQVKTTIFDQNTRIEIYHDNFSGTIHNANGYHYYSNRFINNRQDHLLQTKQTISINGRKAQVLKWQRSKLSSVPEDKNYYLSVEIPVNQQEIYTIIIKSSFPVDQYWPMVKSFNVISKQGQANINTYYTRKAKAWNEETKAFYQTYFGQESPLKWGIFENSAPASMSFLQQLEEKLQYKFEFLVLYKTFDSPFPMEELHNAYDNGKYVELTLQTMLMNQDNSSVTYDILNGSYDYFFHDYAQKAKEFGHPILFRLNNEMNGDWCVFSSYFCSKDTDLYTAVWRHIYNIFRQNQVDNVLWVWNPNDISFPDFAWNHSLNYFPGEEYVDIIGLTGYNTGSYFSGEVWRNFSSIYDPLYEDYSNWFDYPFMITEFGSNSVGGNKARWIEDMFSQIGRFPNIKVAIWFNGVDLDLVGRAARKYRLDETPAILDAFKQGLNNDLKTDGNL